VTGR